MNDVRTTADTDQLREQISALEQLLEVQERSVVEHSERADAALQQLRDNNVILRSVLESMSDGVIVADPNGKFLLFNHAAEEMLGIGMMDVDPEKWSEQYGCYQSDQITPYEPQQLPLARAIHGEKVDEEEMFIRNPQRPRGLWVSINARPMMNDEGKFIGGMVTFRDVTERKQGEEALKRQNDELARTNKELDDFAYIASHDLKEPLRGISNFASFLASDYADKVDEEGREMLETLVRLAQRLERLIDSLLHYSRMGRNALALKRHDLNNILSDVLDSLRVPLEQENVEVQIPEPLPSVRCDRDRVSEVFTHLITNAYIYNDKPAKRIEIGFRHESPAAGDGRRRKRPVFYVRDNGIGMRKKHLDSIFRIFRRLHAREKFGGGPGAGLTFVRKIVERHGGDIWVESKEGEGSTFYFTLQ